VKLPLSWLREYAPFTVEPKRLADDLTSVGLAVDGIETHGAQTVLELDVTTNRVDCMNVYGVAREVAAIYGLALRPLETAASERGAPAGDALEVKVEAPELCGRFSARLLDVKIGPSPAWLRERLELVGIRSINNVVDLTNYVMVEMGQPSHAFDLARVPGASLVVRWSREGETVETLDGQTRTLPAHVGVIAGKGGEPALALAGIMGGASSEIQEDTRTVALEAAWWDPLSTRRAARALGMHTEASHRFERGADVAAGRPSLDRLAHLAEKIGAGSARPGVIEVRGRERPARSIRLRSARVDALVGAPVPWAQQQRTLEALGFAVAGTTAEAEVRPPTWRLDVAREADLVEEVGRHFGLDKIPSALPPSGRVGVLRPSQRRERRIREVLTGIGMTEVINYAFVPAADVAPAPAVRLANPLTSEQDTLRNVDRGAGAGRGAAHQRAARPQGRRALRAGARLPAGSRAPARGAPARAAARGPVVSPPLVAAAAAVRPLRREGHPRAAVRAAGRPAADGRGAGAAARVPAPRPRGAPRQRRPRRGLRRRAASRGRGAYELKGEAVVLELDLESLLEAPAGIARFRSLDRFPAVERDLSILCDESTPAAEIDARVRKVAGERLRSVSLVDRYTGNQVPAGKVSLTVSLRYQDRERTLTSEEVQASVDAVVRELRAAGLEIRGE
jgi:phenylalanyl-tRNA synthetase beta chain